MNVVFRKKHTHHSSTPPRNSECHHCRITVTDRQDRLEADSLYFSQDTEDFRPTGSGPLCNSPVCLVPTLLQLVPRSICINNRCISPSLDSHQRVCQPTLESGRQDTHPGEDPTSHHSAGGTNVQVEILTMVPYTTTHADRLSKTNNNRIRDNGQQGQSLMLPQLAVWHISG